MDFTHPSLIIITIILILLIQLETQKLSKPLNFTSPELIEQRQLEVPTKKLQDGSDGLCCSLIQEYWKGYFTLWLMLQLRGA